MASRQAGKRLFSSLARHAEGQASGLAAPGQALLAQRATTHMLTGAGAAVSVSGAARPSYACPTAVPCRRRAPHPAWPRRQGWVRAPGATHSHPTTYYVPLPAAP